MDQPDPLSQTISTAQDPQRIATLLRQCRPLQISPPWNPASFAQHWGEHTGTAQAVLRGMFDTLANHLTSSSAAAALQPFELSLKVAGSFSQPQALVTELDAQCNSYLIIFAPGLFTCIADRFFRLLTCAEHFPDVGDVGACQTEWSAAPLANIPEDPERLRLAMLLSMMSILLMFYHELAHVLRGHTAFYANLGVHSLPEFQPLATGPIVWPQAEPGAGQAQDADLIRRALEVDADIHAGLFLATVMQQQNPFEEWLFDDMQDSDIYEMVALCAGIAFNAFEAGRSSKLYHLPGTRTECVLEGFARALGLDKREEFSIGLNNALQFCAEHYQAPGELDDFNADIDLLENHTWPMLVKIRDMFAESVPQAWLQRQTQSQTPSGAAP
ncbi:hypothetical protein V8J88_07760 [Massilia sp. W12]|uniref:hypothetical protein n=1 Tax=Massilia sp. W12 TaxID=3126507 RepID=UPI0030D5516A